MGNENQFRRMTLRQLVTHSEKCSKELFEHVQKGMISILTDFRELSRPVRRRSHYPKLQAIQNSLRKIVESNEKNIELIDQLEECLEEVRKYAKRELVNRI